MGKNKSIKKLKKLSKNKHASQRGGGIVSTMMDSLLGKTETLSDIVTSMLNKDIIVHLPNTFVVKSKSKIEEYRLSVDAFTLLNIILHHENFLQSKHIQSIIKKSSPTNKKLDEIEKLFTFKSKLNIDEIVHDLTNYAFENNRNQEEMLIVASMMMVTAKMIYLQTLGNNGNTVFENDKEIILEQQKPTVH